MPSLFIYALGGGLGHLTRAAALARATPSDARADARVRILTNSPYAGCVQRALPELDIVALPPAMTVAQAWVEVPRQIQAAAPDALIVDTFPRGLGGELVDILAAFSGCKAFVQRDLNPRYSAAFDLDAFIRTAYDLILVPGDIAPGGLHPLPQAVTTLPWLVRSHQELPARQRARQLLNLQDNRPCILVCAAGNPDELNWYGTVATLLRESARTSEVRCIAPVCPDTCPPGCWVPYWPAMDLFTAADVVIGGAGYNTIYECLASGVPLIARPWPRKYDRQRLRADWASRSGSVVLVEEPRQAVTAALEALASAPPGERKLQFPNGATHAALIIHQMVVESNRGG